MLGASTVASILLAATLVPEAYGRHLKAMDFQASILSVCVYEADVDYPGNDISNAVASRDQCCDRCKSVNGCNAWTWTSQSGGTCYFKSRVGDKVAKQGASSAIVNPSGNECSFPLETNIDFVGNDIANRPSNNPGDCCPICKGVAGCRAYSWNNQNGGTCYLKSLTGERMYKQGVISAKVFENPNQCNAVQEQNTDFVGNDIGNKPSSNPGGCCSICQNFSGCRAYSWNNQNGGTCYLKSLTGQKIAKDGVISATVIPNPEQCSSTAEVNVDFVGFDIANKPSSTSEGCCAACKSTANCRAYSWTNQSGGTCYLKSISGERIAKQGVTSAVVYPNPEPPCQIQDGVDYVNNDIANVRAANAKDCCYICQGRASSGCKAFSWSDYQGGTCWLKSGKGDTAQKAGVKSATA